jgi:alpha-beta hydrolase superfamily lysophospholipase
MVREQLRDTSSMHCENSVLFPSADGSVKLAGTLAMPPEGRTAPAVVLVSGTGPIDRDVTFVGHALFRTVAHTLAKRGVASLRFDKRGIGESEGDFSSARAADFVSDVLGASEYLVTKEGFAAEHVGLLGHSEGGLVALTAAARAPRTPFCVSLAGPLLSGRENAVRSFALLARGSLERDGEFHRYSSELDTLIEIARSPKPFVREAEAKELAERLAPHIFNDRTHVILGSKSLSGREFFRLLSSTCLDTVLSWEPKQVVPLVMCPVLLLYGSKDVQVPALENVSAAQALVNQLGKSDWTIREYDGMNHAFQRCETGMPDEYASISYVMAEEVVEEVAAWIKGRTQV